MTTRQRTDLHMNIPALRKLDGMVIVRELNFKLHTAYILVFIYQVIILDLSILIKQEVLENFKDQNEFSYMSKNATDSQKAKNKRNEDKWWVPTPKVPPNGLSDVTRKWLQFQKDSVNQVHKAAMAINAQILSEMEIPESYIESLPKVCWGELEIFDYVLGLSNTNFFPLISVEWEGLPWGFDL